MPKTLDEVENGLVAQIAALTKKLEAVRLTKTLINEPQQMGLSIPHPTRGGIENPGRTYGSVGAEVSKAVSEQKPEFTIFDVDRLLKENGIDLNVQSIRTAFRRLVSTGQLKIISQGQGRRASVY